MRTLVDTEVVGRSHPELVWSADHRACAWVLRTLVLIADFACQLGLLLGLSGRSLWAPDAFG